MSSTKSNRTDVTNFAITKQSLTAHDYTCFVVNKSDWQITHVKIVPTNSEGPITPPIGRTAPTTMSCEEARHTPGRYQPFINFQCDATPVEVQLKLKKGSQTAYTEPLTIEPDCEYGGEVRCLDLDGAFKLNEGCKPCGENGKQSDSDGTYECSAVVHVKDGRVLVQLNEMFNMPPGTTMPLLRTDHNLLVVSGGGDAIGVKNGHAII